MGKRIVILVGRLCLLLTLSGCHYFVHHVHSHGYHHHHRGHHYRHYRHHS